MAKKGNTVLRRIKTNYDLRDANKIEVIFGQKGRFLLVKSGDDVTAEEDAVLVLMKPADTVLFEPGRLVPVEITAYYDEGTQITSNAMYRPFDGTMKGEYYERKLRRR